MSLAEKVGQLFMVSLDGTIASPAATGSVRDWGVGGIILYGPNVRSGPQIRAFIGGLQRVAHVPMLVGVDEEGGIVNRIPPAAGVSPLLPPDVYGRLGSAPRVYRDALAAGRDLRALGINLNFAPELDVLSNPNSPIGTRSYGADPALVARLGAAAIRGYQDAGIAATAKHFLGLGGVPFDAHLTLPVSYRGLKDLEGTDLVPLRAAVGAGVATLMVTHIVLPSLDRSGTPASLSYPAVTGYIRGRLGYRGVIVTDSLYMGAITTRMTVASAAVSAVAAGCDLLLISIDRPIPAAVTRGALRAVEQAVAGGRISRVWLDSAVRRVLALKERLGLLP